MRVVDLSILYTLPRKAEDIRTELKAHPEYKDLFVDIRNSASYWRDNFTEDASKRAGWIHNYVCPKCSEPLIFDAACPDLHDCTACDGKGDGNDEKITEAWTAYRRYSISAGMVHIGLMVYLGEEGFLREDVLRMVHWYAGHYAQMPEYGLWGGRGKIFGQSLCEAVNGLNYLHALRLIGFDGKSEEGQMLHHKLFLPMARLVMAQSGIIQNVPMWHAAFAVGAAAFFGDERLMCQSLGFNDHVWTAAEMGGYNQIVKGFSPDGLQNENSMLYHYYGLEAATNLCTYLRYTGLEQPVLYQRVLDAYMAPVRLAFENGEVPAINDGWRGTNALEDVDKLRAVYAMLDGVADTDELQKAIWFNPAKTEKPSVGSLLYGTPPRVEGLKLDRNANLTHNYLAMLRGPADVYMKYGNTTTSHAHPDALHIDIYPWGRDTGTTGYGSVLFSEFLTQTICHNTFCVDGKNHENRAAHGDCSFNEDGRGMQASIDDAYTDVTARRALRWEGGELMDHMALSSSKEHIFDWVFHGKGDFSYQGTARDHRLCQQENGYQHLRSVKHWQGPRAQFTWVYQGRRLTLTLSSETASQAEIYVTESPDNPGHLMRSGVLVRCIGKKMDVRVVWTIG